MLCKIGDIEVWRILELDLPFMLPEQLYPNAGPEVSAIIQAEVPGALCPTSGRLILPVQGFLLKTPTHTILVDSCVGNDKTAPNDPDWNKRSDVRFVAALTAAGVAFEDVDYVLCTHLHIDHVGWNTRLEDGRWVPTFPNARYLMPAADEEMQRTRDTPVFNESVLPVIEAGQAEMVQPGHKLGKEITLMPTPGHTPGHVSVVLQSGDDRAVITGDAMHCSAQCQHPEWHFLYDSDPNLAVASRTDLLGHAAETGCLVLGSHFSLPSLGRVQEDNGSFIWKDLK